MTLVLILTLIGLTLAVLQALRLADRRRAERLRARLLARSCARPPRFDPAMVRDLPEPARRYFLHAIAPGARLDAAVEIGLAGQIGLGDRSSPRYLPMRARQILAPPEGFVWQAEAGSGPIHLSGFDGYAGGVAWTRFWLCWLIPVARASGRGDLARSAAGRGIAEAVFWAPAALLPRQGVAWTAPDAGTARVTVEHRGCRHVVDLTLDPAGRPLTVLLQRWSRENPERAWRLQPFGGTVDAVARFGDYTLASRITGGNHFGTPDYFPFYRVEVTRLRLLPPTGHAPVEPGPDP